MVSDKERRYLYTNRWKRRKTIFRKLDQYLHMSDSGIYLMIRRKGENRAPFVHHFHPKSKWPDMSWGIL